MVHCKLVVWGMKYFWFLKKKNRLDTVKVN